MIYDIFVVQINHLLLRSREMLTTLTISVFVGLSLIVGALKLTVRDQPGGCMVGFGLFFVILLASVIIPQIILV